MLKDYANIFYAPQLDEDSAIVHMCAIYGEAMEFFYSPEVEKDGALISLRDMLVDRFRVSILESHVFKQNYTAEDEIRIRKLIREWYGDKEVETGEDLDSFICSRYRSYLLVQEEIGEAVEKVIRRILAERPHVDYSRKSWDDFMILNSYISTLSEILEMIDYAKISPEEKRKLAMEIIPEANILIREIPYPFFPEMLNPNISQLFGHIRPFFEGEEECIDEIMNLIIRRQPITYIHSLMVAEIVTVITEEAMKELPERFVGILGITRKEEVPKAREKILSFIKTGALLHDIGKCNITDVINRQSRRLTEDEFSMIKYHPFLGRKLTDKMPELAKYGDLIEGHHRSYDGKSGYPGQFDIVNSPCRFLIDILSIADSTDAATDILGRNYAKGKDFYSLLSEFSAGKGTRYNPELVEMIEKNHELQDKLCKMTSGGRYDTYYKAYMDIVG